MDFNHTIGPYNPTGRRDAWQALEQALWTTFGYFLARCDRFSVYYHPGDPAVAPLLALGFEPRQPAVAHARLELTGALTDAVRRLLWGEGRGKFPCFAVTLCRGEQQLCNIVEHEQRAMLSAEAGDLAALTAAGVNPRFIRPWSRSSGQPAPAQWHVSMHLLGGALAGAAAGVSDYTIRPGAPPAEDSFAFWVRWGQDPEVGLHLECTNADLEAVRTAQAAAAAVASLGPPPRPGDSLRLDATGVISRLPPRPRWRNFRFTRACLRPSRAEWLTAVRLVGARADRFAVAWRDEPPAANGWDSGYALDQLLPACDREGSSDWLTMAREAEGDLTPAVLALLVDEPATGIPDLEHTTLWQAGDEPPAPWWHLVLLREGQILLQSADNGLRLELDLTDAEAAALDVPPGRLYDYAGANRQQQAVGRLTGVMRGRLQLPRANPDVVEVSTTHPSGQRWELKHKDGTLLATLTVAPAALRPLALMPQPEKLVLTAPAGRHLLVEWDGSALRCRVLPDAPDQRSC